jgi:hypothetical protein
VKPLELAALLASLLGALALIVATSWNWLPRATLATCWLAVLWLVLAWRWRHAPLFAAFQGALAVAVVLGVGQMLQEQPWFDPSRAAADVRAWQASGVGLSLLALAWVIARFGLRGSERAWVLLEPGWPAFDRCLLAGLVVLQLAVSVLAVISGIMAELFPAGMEELHGYGPLGWSWLAVLAIALALVLHQKQVSRAVAGLAILGICVPVVAAGAWWPELAVASALRWGLSLAFVAGSALLWARRPIEAMAKATGITADDALPIAATVRILFIAGIVVPVLVLTTIDALLGFSGVQAGGPTEDSFFHSAGTLISNLVPLVLVCVGLAGHAVRERSAGYAFSGGLVALTAGAGGYALDLVTNGYALGVQEVVILGQLATIVAAVWLLAWLAVSQFLRIPASDTLSLSLWPLPCRGMQTLQAALVWTTLLAWLLPVTFILSFPQLSAGSAGVAALKTAVGSSLGWLALALAASATLALTYQIARHLLVHVTASTAILIGVLAACGEDALDPGNAWTGYHVLTACWTVVAGGLLAAAWRADVLTKLAKDHREVSKQPWWTSLVTAAGSQAWVTGLGAVLVVLAIANGASDPARPTWPCGLVLAVSFLAGAVTVWTRRGESVFVSGLLFNVAGYLFWLTWMQASGAVMPLAAFRLAWIQVLCLGTASLLWSIIEIGCRRLGWPLQLTADHLPFRHLASWATLVLVVGVTAVLFSNDLFVTSGRWADPLAWIAISLAALAAAATLWDQPPERWAGPLPQLFVLGFAAIGLGLDAAELIPVRLLWNASLACGCYVLYVSLITAWCLRHPTIGEDLTMPPRPHGWPLTWLLPAQTLVGALVILLALWTVLTFGTFSDRLASAVAVAALLAGGIVLTPHWPRLLHGWRTGPDNQALEIPLLHLPQQVNLLLGTLVCVLAHCALVGLDDPAPWLHRTVLTMAAVVWTSLAYGLLLPRLLGRDNSWSVVARRLAMPLGLAACVCLGLVLIQEFVLYDPSPTVRSTPLAWPAVALVAVTLAALIAGALTFAVAPRRDVLRLSERGRTLYVYGAEILVFLLLVHLRLNIPDFNLGWYGRFWPFIVMALAFAGVGVSELFHRRGLTVLADPLQRTAMFLPLLPLLAFLVQPLAELRVQADQAVAGLQPFTRYLQRLPNDFHWHAAVWFLMGGLYLIVAITRRSSNIALVAVLLANFGLWVLLGHSGDLTFAVHPQLWLIPVGLIVLAAEQLNRERLEPAQSMALRYAGLLMIYLSSTADMFIAGLGRSVVLPIALAVLAVVGVLAGILLRVRAFLFLGVTFLFLDVFSQIWHAAVDRSQTWVWWASGIVLGVAILTLFALFEKRRNDMLKMIEEIKRWK